jgi:WD40 repeat protein
MGEPIVRVQFNADEQLATYGMARHKSEDARRWCDGVRKVESVLFMGGAQTNNTLNFLEVYNPQTGEVVQRIPLTWRPLRVAYSGDREHAATLTNGNLSVWHLPSRTLLVDRESRTHGGWLALAFAPHGRRIVTGGIDSTVGMWDPLASGPPLRVFQWGVGPVYAVTFDHDGLRAAAAGHSGVSIWDADE